MADLLPLLVPLMLIAVGFVCGRLAERKHLARLCQREADNREFLITQLKSFPARTVGSEPPQIVLAETVVSSDYFKTSVAKLRGLFGGEVRSFQSLLDRARRETTQRLVEQAQHLGYNAICNLRLERADVGGSTADKKAAAMVAILGSATAYHYDQGSS